MDGFRVNGHGGVLHFHVLRLQAEWRPGTAVHRWKVHPLPSQDDTRHVRFDYEPEKFMKSVLPKSLATQVPVSPFNGSKCNTSIAHLMSITEINADCNFIDAKWRRSIFHFDSAVKSPELLQKRGVVETPRATRSPDQLCTSGLPFKLIHLVQLLNFPWNCSAQNPMILGTPNPSASLCRNSLNSSHSCGFEVCVSIFMGSCIHVHMYSLWSVAICCNSTSRLPACYFTWQKQLPGDSIFFTCHPKIMFPQIFKIWNIHGSSKVEIPSVLLLLELSTLRVQYLLPIASFPSPTAAVELRHQKTEEAQPVRSASSRVNRVNIKSWDDKNIR